MAILEKLNIRATVMVAVTTLIAVLLVLYIWRLPPFRTAIEQTENAYVRGSITIIAPKIDGYVAEVLVQDFMSVEAGQLLVRLDDRSFNNDSIKHKAISPCRKPTSPMLHRRVPYAKPVSAAAVRKSKVPRRN